MRERRNLSTLWLISIILLILNSCTPSFSPALMKADKILSTDYEQGKMMLDSIYHADNNMSTADMKYYQLLRIKATDKAYRPIANQKGRIDSLVSFFEGAGNDNLLAETYFYAGRINYEIGDKPTALKYFQKAKEVVGKDNYALQGDIYCQMANVYRYVDLNKEALETLMLAWEADSLGGYTRNMLYDIRDVGESYRGQGDFKNAEHFFLKGLKMARNEKDSFMTRCFHHELAALYIKQQKWDSALLHIKYYVKNMEDISDKSGMLVTALKIYTHFKDRPNIDICQKRIFCEGNVFAKQYAIESLLFEKAYSSKDSTFLGQLSMYKDYTDSVNKENNAMSVKQAEQSYNYSLKEIENKNLQKSSWLKTIGLIMAIIIILFLILYGYMNVRYMKQKQIILEFKLEKYKELKRNDDARAKDKVANKHEIIANSEIYKTIIAEINMNSYRFSEEQWKQLQKLVNSVYINFDKNLHGFLDKISLNEYKICLLIKIGISPTNIAHFVHVSKEAISASRRRMYKKAFGKERGTPAEWDEIITSL